ncbi:unnamed protein product [Thlaspi arvense]|uniref:Uncharacterized protein n=1 Tax=Thlaspi arvense TaxID=13288 RepID=A0AAU9SKJ3_THLAR|nr:unnamed protein product [Thlaspi arvense]
MNEQRSKFYLSHHFTLYSQTKEYGISDSTCVVAATLENGAGEPSLKDVGRIGCSLLLQKQLHHVESFFLLRDVGRIGCSLLVLHVPGLSYSVSDGTRTPIT